MNHAQINVVFDCIFFGSHRCLSGVVRAAAVWLLLVFGVAATAPTSALAACARVGATSVHRCPSTGDAAADGQSLNTYLNNLSFTCGDTIVLDGGAEYNAPLSVGTSFPHRLKPQTGCTGDARTRIISSRLSEIRTDVLRDETIARADLDAGKYAIIRMTGGNPNEGPPCGISLYGAANNFYLGGLAILTGSDTITNDRDCYAVASASSYTISVTMADLPRKITFDRMLVAGYPWETYGPITSHTNIEQYFDSLKNGIAIDGTDIDIINSTVLVLGYDPGQDTQVSITSATAADPVVLTSTGISAALGLSSGQTMAAAIDGATDAWSDLNGMKAVKYLSADTVEVYKGDGAWQVFPDTFDGTGKGTLAGTVILRKAVIGSKDPMYDIFTGSGAQRYRVLNNYLADTSGMNIFVGGGTYEATQKRTTLSADSTATSLNVASTALMKVGDLIANIPNNGSPSTYCPGPGKGCYGGGAGSLRVAQVTAINSPTNVTVAPWGPAGLDYAPPAGNTIVWDGNAFEGVEIRGNTFKRYYNFPITGKGPIELKSCRFCLIDGNVMDQGPAGNYFITPRNQVGPTPWNRCDTLAFSNNLTGSAVNTTMGGYSRYVLSCLDDEMTATPGQNVWARNNLSPQVKLTGVENFGGGSFKNGGFLHNTVTAHVNTATHTGWQGGGATCTTDATGYWDNTAANVQTLNNITLYGNNNWATECPMQQPGALISGNILTASVPASQSEATINARHSGNTSLSVANTAAELHGTCEFDNYTNCRLASGSTYRGTATDGGDPGADVYELQDSLNRWSEQAGLTVPSVQEAIPRMILHPGAWSIGSTFAAARFRLHASSPVSGCTVQVFTNRNRSTAHADSATPQACNRTYSVSNGSVVTYLFGGGTTLTANTLYFYEIIDGGRKMVGEFRTKPAGSGEAYTWSRAMECGTDGATFGTSVSAGTAYSVSAGGVRYCRESSPVGNTMVLVAR